MSFGFNKPLGAAGTPASGFSFGAPTTANNSGTTAPATSPFAGFGQQPSQTPLQQQQQASNAAGTGMFGQAQQNTAQPASSLFGASSTSGSSLFGAKPATPAAPASNPFASFGQQQNSAAAPAASTGLFGQQQQQQTATPSLFGGQQQQGQTAAPSLFGGQQQQTGTSSLFGAQPQQQQAGTSSLFGAQQQQPAAGSSLFGAKPACTGSLFGQQSTQGGGGLFGGQQSTTQQPGMFGQQGLQNTTSLQNSTAAPTLPKNTKFSDLPADAQKKVEEFDSFIKSQKQIGASIDMENIGRAIWQTTGDVKAAADEQAAIAQGLHSLKQSLEQLAVKVNSEAQDLQKLLETWEAAKPADARHGAIRPVAHRDFPQEYFYRVATGLEERVTRYKRTITLLTRAVSSLASDQDSLSPQVVAQTIQNNQNAIMSLAASLERLQLRMNDLRGQFTEDYRERTNSMRDPFEVAREEKGVSLLRA